MNTLLVDPPATPRSEQPTATDRDGGHSGGSGPSGGEPAQPSPQGRACSNCAAPIQDGQQWCLQCGAAQPGSLAARQSWRPLTALALAAVLLVGAAAAAGAAALRSGSPSKPSVPVASTPTPTVSTPTTSVPTTPTVPATPGGATTPTAKVPPVGTGNSLFPSTGKPPKIPATAPTPKTSPGTGAGSTTPSGTGTGEKTSTTTTGSKTETGTGAGKQAEEAPSALLLDTNAARTYNPYDYPAAGFGDPALAIDGEPTTAWTAQVQPSSAPNMAEGLLVDLKSPTKVGAVTLVTQTKGMTVQLYGTAEKKAPATITEAGWKQISATHVLKKRTTHVKLHGKQALRYLLVWVVKAPPSAVGTPQAPGQVDLNEVELFPPVS